MYNEITQDQRKISWYIFHKPWLVTMVHSDKPWPMNDVQWCSTDLFISEHRQIWIVRDYFLSFSTQRTLLPSFESRKGRNSITGNLQAHIHNFNKVPHPLFASHKATTLLLSLPLWMLR